MDTQDLVRLAAARAHASTGSGRVIRQAAGVTVGDIAMAIGVTEPTVWRWEEGIHRPRRAAGIRWAKALEELSKQPATSA